MIKKDNNILYNEFQSFYKTIYKSIKENSFINFNQFDKYC